MLILIPIPKKGSTNECPNHWTIALLSHASKVVRKILLKILHDKLQHNANQELPNIQVGFRKERGIRDQVASFHWGHQGNFRNQGNFRKTSTSLSSTVLSKVFDYVDHDKLWKALTEMGLPGHFNCLLRNLYVGEKSNS